MWRTSTYYYEKTVPRRLVAGRTRSGFPQRIPGGRQRAMKTSRTGGQPEPEPAGPFLKWAGGKGQILSQFTRFLPSSLEGRHYVEPCL